MTQKQQIKQSEAKILVYLSVVHNTRKHVTAIANKLEIDYSYVMRVLQAMVAKGWLKKHQYRRHMFYDLTLLAPLSLAKENISSLDLQKDLEANYTQEELIQPKEVVKDDRKTEESEDHEQIL